MRIAVTADTHGSPGVIIKCWKKLQLDQILFAGDFYKDGKAICRRLGIPGHIIAGNCDGPGHTGEEVIAFGECTVWLVHGHQYGVKKDLQRIFYRGRELNVNAVVFGHTHLPLCEQVDGLWLINPGSPTRPRSSKLGTYALMDIEEHYFSARIVALD